MAAALVSAHLPITTWALHGCLYPLCPRASTPAREPPDPVRSSRETACSSGALDCPPPAALPSSYVSALLWLPTVLIFSLPRPSPTFFFFFLNTPAPPEIYPFPLHTALPI